MLSPALFSAPHLRSSPAENDLVGLYTGLQGAFSARRFVPEDSGEGARYRVFDAIAAAVVLTTSTKDNANWTALWSRHVGGRTGLRYMRRHDELEVFSWPGERGGDHLGCDGPDLALTSRLGAPTMNPRHRFFVRALAVCVLATAVVLSGCSGPDGRLARVLVGQAPEDLALGRVGSHTRLFTATAAGVEDSRWFPVTSFRRNQLWSFDPDDMSVEAGFGYEKACNPLAVDLVEHPRDDPATPLLYVLNTDCDNAAPASPCALAQSAARLYQTGVAVFDAADLTWRGDIFPAETGPGKPFESPNSLAATSDGMLYVSNFQSVRLGPTRERPVPSAPGAGFENDSIVMMDTRRPAAGWSMAAGELGGANGLLLSGDERHLFVSAWRTGKVWCFARGVDGRLSDPVLLFDAQAAIGGSFHPDNLSFGAEDGVLIVTGQSGEVSAGLHVGLHSGIGVATEIVTLRLKRAEIEQGVCPTARLLRRDPLPADFGAVSEAVVHAGRFYFGQVVRPYIGITETAGGPPPGLATERAVTCPTPAR